MLAENPLEQFELGENAQWLALAAGVLVFLVVFLLSRLFSGGRKAPVRSRPTAPAEERDPFVHGGTSDAERPCGAAAIPWPSSSPTLRRAAQAVARLGHRSLHGWPVPVGARCGRRGHHPQRPYLQRTGKHPLGAARSEELPARRPGIRAGVPVRPHAAVERAAAVRLSPFPPGRRAFPILPPRPLPGMLHPLRLPRTIMKGIMMSPLMLVSAYHTNLEQSALLVLDLEYRLRARAASLPRPDLRHGRILCICCVSSGPKSRLEKYDRGGLCWMRRVADCLDPHSLALVGDELAGSAPPARTRSSS